MQDHGFPNGADDAHRGVDFIGVSCGFVCHDGNGRFVLSRRSMHCRDEQGCWEHGSGSHEFGQRIEETVQREIEEEYGAHATDIQFLGVVEAHRQLQDGTPTHWVNVLYGAKVDPEEVHNNEPYKIDIVDWFTLDTLPTPIKPHIRKSLDTAHSAGII